jgi:hypothetical protein
VTSVGVIGLATTFGIEVAPPTDDDRVDEIERRRQNPTPAK